MRRLFVHRALRADLVAAVACLSSLAGCGRETPTGLKLEAPPTAEFVLIGTPAANAPISVTGVVGQAVGTALEVVDRNGHPVSRVPVSWAVVHDGGSTDSIRTSTDSSGIARVSWTLDTVAKLDSLRASLASGDTVIVTGTARHAAAAAATKISGDSQIVAVGAPSQPFVVRLTDRYGNPISRAAVAWLVNGGGTLSAVTTTTDTSGTARVTLSTDANTVGAYRIIATYGVVPASTFTLTSTIAPVSEPRLAANRAACPVSRCVSQRSTSFLTSAR